jgi:hypothetical protein
MKDLIEHSNKSQISGLGPRGRKEGRKERRSSHTSLPPRIGKQEVGRVDKEKGIYEHK